ncbi:sporulation peptidase YabG [Paenibacillus agricola]|uniref:Sporulation peptidase YabG n=1 Tax=Paenibacillus agricola TaxID=2716264 RepID=A0ABX0JHN5_9BACL|nr:sporulation peptidase YabG [Paenibacillus agricola]NHN35088.1 sporulation peptidase YabG [Paenibacillus agricola]
MKQGDLVTRRSYGHDIVFKVQELLQQQAILWGVEYRLLADAPLSDLSTAPMPSFYPDSSRERPPWMDRIRSPELQLVTPIPKDTVGNHLPSAVKGPLSYFEMPGKVLHLDGDPAYLRKCMNLYGELRVPAEGFFVPEAKMAEALYRLLPQIKPDIVVVTGHDGIIKHQRNGDMNLLGSYKNSHHFVHAVKTARQYEKNKDALTVIAGACQSHFEAILQAGANYASSPARVLIHALDPLCIAAKVAFTSIRDTVNVADVISLTHSGFEGIGGIESRGSFRKGIPHFNKTTSVPAP